ncbi:hypothetical protein NEOLEDRAFT_1122557 [Neolentinus lepideus HHB14362 ss-1]|uniref:Protein N-terminal and lysine N-methyltransferase EFM7 n=1 Tax=Neolentinus lepideus HHB14362 ss-1 TaxID=1314782 RepID=A0A165P4X5_9AGAM|nr:hypothetical protein NEOLEDRAFT_1122557 [Neolentinus lepideus HHB14362 ss-1]
MADADELSLDAVFTEEEKRSPTPPATSSIYTREKPLCARDDTWREVRIRLVGSHPLWGHYLWNAARAFASYLDQNKEIYAGGSVLELGAGGGLPGIVCALNGARQTVLTDYPDKELVDNLMNNVQENLPEARRESVVVQGYIWGQSIDSLLSLTPEGRGFDLIILSDLVFNHSQHDALLKTCDLSLSKVSTASVLVFYTHHRPQYAQRDLEFFKKAEEREWNCEEILTRKYPPMFPDDPGEEEVRATVHGWRLTRNSKCK